MLPNALHSLRIPLATVCLLPALLGGCEERVKGWSWGVAKPAADDSSVGPAADYRPPSDDQLAVGQRVWSIVLDRLEGPDHALRAQARREALAEQTGLKDLWVAPDGPGSVVYYRRYRSQNDSAARRDLDYWRQLASTGQIRLSVLMLSPVNDAADAQTAELDLRTAGRRGIYSLQIAYFDENFPGGKFRAAAEKAAADLRARGLEGFFYHGPNRSMVTVGVFGQDAVTLAGGAYQFSAPLRALMQRFPHNAANAVQEARAERADQPRDPSFLVEIPGAR
jgi:hypothetical protein